MAVRRREVSPPSGAQQHPSSNSSGSSDSCRVSLGLFYGSFLCLAGVMGISAVFPPPVLLQMLLYTAPILYAGSHLSLKQNEVDAITGEKLNKGETMNRTDAMLFPVFGSIALFSLYLAYKFLSPAWVNMLLTVYLSGVGLLALGETITAVARPLCPPALCRDILLTFPLPGIVCLLRRTCFGPRADKQQQDEQQQQQGEQKQGEEQQQQEEEDKHHPGAAAPAPAPAAEETDDSRLTLHVTPLWVASHFVALAVCGLWLWKKHWVLHNILAIAFCVQAIAIVSVGSFAIAAILLCGLFVYDVFWVFGTEVMVSVAKAFEGPAKLIFPVQLSPFQYSILGLGDVVIPGVFISMCLRFDAFLAEQQQAPKSAEVINTAVDIHQRFPKFYFWVVLVFYEVGLLTTGLVMLAVNHPQPALLYLVPYCLFSLFGAAALNGKVKDVLAYKEDEDASSTRPSPLPAASPPAEGAERKHKDL